MDLVLQLWRASDRAYWDSVFGSLPTSFQYESHVVSINLQRDYKHLFAFQSVDVINLNVTYVRMKICWKAKKWGNPCIHTSIWLIGLVSSMVSLRKWGHWGFLMHGKCFFWKAQTTKTKKNVLVFSCSSKREKMCCCDSSSWHIHFSIVKLVRIWFWTLFARAGLALLPILESKRFFLKVETPNVCGERPWSVLKTLVSAQGSWASVELSIAMDIHVVFILYTHTFLVPMANKNIDTLSFAPLAT